MDFFISHRGGEGSRHAAEARQALEDAGFRVVSQHPDIAPGDNFLVRIHEFLKQARDLVVILTRDYDESRYTLLELTSHLATAAQVGESRRLLVLRVEDCRPPGLLAAFHYVDLVTVADPEARRALIVAAAHNEPRVDFTRARRSVDAALRHRLVRESPEEASQLASLVGDAARTRLVRLNSHAAGVTTDFGASIREFIALYAGTDGTDDIFGGRERELTDLTRWFAAPGAPPYRLITATAGRGKSMLVVRWALDAVASRDVDLVFIPISIRCQTNTATVVLQALVSRLALLHDQETPVLTGAAPEVLCDLARGYLHKERTGERRTLVILDGLDEAVDREIFRGLLPTNPPPSLRVLLTARSTSVSADDDEWRAQLGFGAGTPRARRDLLQLWPLDRLDAATVISTVLEALSGVIEGALEPVAAELLRLSEGEPFVLKLYLQHILEAGESSGGAILERLRHIEPGVHAYFSDWWAQQSALWSKLAIDEGAVISVLSALSVAHGPMTVNDLQAVISPMLSGYAIKNAIGHLRRFLVTSRGHRVAIFHDRLAEFVRASLMSASDMAALRQSFINWGLDVVARRARSPSPPGSPVPEYVLRHLGAHLHGHEVALEKLTPLRSRRWADAWLDLEGHHAGFISDVTLVLDRAIARYENAPDADGSREALLIAVEAILARGSAISMAEAIPTALLPLLLEDRVWSGAQMLAYVRTIHKAETRRNALRAIADAIPPEQLAAFIDVADAIRDTRSSSAALASIGSRLSGATASTYVDTVSRFNDPVERAYMLRRVDTTSDIALRHRVLKVLEESQGPGLENHQLAQLAIAKLNHVDPQLWQITFDDAVRHAQRITADEGVISGMGRLLKMMALCDLADLCRDATISVVLARAVLGVLETWPPRGAPDAFLEAGTALGFQSATLARWVFSEAWALASRRAAGDNTGPSRNGGLVKLARAFDATLWPGHTAEVTALMRSVVERRSAEPYEMYYDVAMIIGQLSADLLHAFEARIVEIPEDDEYRWRAELLRLQRLPADRQCALAQQIVERCTELSELAWSTEIRAQALAFVPAHQRSDAVRTTLLASRSIRDDYECTNSIRALVACLSGDAGRLSDAAFQMLLAYPNGLGRMMRDVAACLTPRQVEDTLQALRSEKIHDGGRLEVMLAIAGSITNEQMPAYRSCAEAIDARGGARSAAMFALLGVGSSAMLDLDALHAWLLDAGNHLQLPSRLNQPQIDFLADRYTQIRDDRKRVVVGGRIAAELVRRGAWTRHVADVIAHLHTGAGWDADMLDPTMVLCSYTEAIAIFRAAHGQVSAGLSGALLRHAIGKASAGTEFGELTTLVLAGFREGRPAEVFNDRHRSWREFDVLETLCRFPVPPHVVDEIVDLARTLEQSNREKLLRYVAPWMNATTLEEYVVSSRALYVPADRLEALSPIFPRLAAAVRAEIFADMTEWVETRYCGEKSLAYLRMSEQCDVDAFDVARRVLSQVVQSSSIGGSGAESRDLVVALASWRDSRRLTEVQYRTLVGELLKRVTSHDRAHVMQTLACMGSVLKPLFGVSVFDFLDRIAGVLQEWR